METVRLFPKLVWFEAQRFKAYPLEAIANVLERGLTTLLYIVFWLIVGRYSGNKTGLSAKSVVSYYLIVGGVTPFFYTAFGIASQFIKLIKHGELNQLLIRPVNVLVYPWAIRTGRNAVNLLIGAVQVVVALLISAPTWQLHHYLLLLPVLFCMFSINAAFNMLIGTLAFYYTEVKGFLNSAVHIARLLRGELMPLYLLPLGLFHILQFTPFPASLYYLVGLLQTTHSPSWTQVGIGVAWGAALLWVAARFWAKGLKRYEAIGI